MTKPFDIVQTVVDGLNRLLEADRDTVTKLVNHRVECRQDLVQSGFQVFVGLNGPELGLLGVLNGVLGPLDQGKAVIAVAGQVDGMNRFTRIDGFMNLLPMEQQAA